MQPRAVAPQLIQRRKSDQQVLGNRGSGYDELAQLEQPLVGDDSSYGGGDDYQRSHGVQAPGQYSDFGGGGGGGAGFNPANSALPGHVTQTIPSQVHDQPGFSLNQASTGPLPRDVMIVASQRFLRTSALTTADLGNLPIRICASLDRCSKL